MIKEYRFEDNTRSFNDSEIVVRLIEGTIEEFDMTDIVPYSNDDVYLSNLKKIYDYEFYDCAQLKYVKLREKITKIGDWAFCNCKSLKSIFIPKTVDRIGSYAFRECDNLTIYCEAASQPNGWDPYWNYSNCPVVWDVENKTIDLDGISYSIYDGEAHIEAYKGSRTELTIPATITYNSTTYSVTEIKPYAFEDNTTLKKITLPNSITHINRYVFFFCDNLTTIILPASIKYIGEKAFCKIPAMVLTYEGTLEQWSNINKASPYWYNSGNGTQNWGYVSCIDGNFDVYIGT